MNKPAIVLVVGPTGIGKTQVSIEIAKKLDTEIISCDSMQIYKYMDIGTAKVTPNEAQGIVHHMVNIVEPTQNYSVCDYVSDSKKAIEGIVSKGKIPLVVGGTGLYADSLVNGIDFYESAPADIEYREQLFKLAEEKGACFIHKMLESVDKKSSESIHPNNVKRVIRALEYYHVTGETISAHNDKTKLNQSPYKCCKIGFIRSRDKLYERINKRVDIMLKSGLIDEVKKLIDMGCTKEHTSMQAIGYKEVVDYLSGEIRYDDMVETLKRDSRRYAKRQITWFKRDKTIHWIDLDNAINADFLADDCIKIINSVIM